MMFIDWKDSFKEHIPNLSVSMKNVIMLQLCDLFCVHDIGKEIRTRFMACDYLMMIFSPIYSPISASSNTSLSDYNETSFIVQDLEDLVLMNYNTQVCYIINTQVIWNLLFSKHSLMDKGTMYQLKNLLNFIGISADPSKNMKVSVLLLLQNAAAKTVLDLNPSASKSPSYIARVFKATRHKN